MDYEAEHFMVLKFVDRVLSCFVNAEMSKHKHCNFTVHAVTLTE